MKIQSAVIGCGRMGAFTSESVQKFAPRCWLPLSHAEAIRSHPLLDLAALCDSNAESLDKAAAAFNVKRTFSDYRSLIGKLDLELIGIATRTAGRAEIVRYAAAAGVRALHIEKPLCNSALELAALTNTLASPELFCTYGAIRRFFEIYQAARTLANSGAYGALREIRVNIGRGMLYWTHPHSVDLILFMAGDRLLETVQARLSNVKAGRSAVEVISDPIVDSASIYFTDGVAGHVSRASGHAVILSCAEAEIAVENDGQSISILTRRGEDPYFYRMPAREEGATAAQGTLAPVSQLVRCLAGDREQQRENASLKAQILLGQQILFAMVQSHIEKSRLIGLQEIDPAMSVLAEADGKYA